MLKHQVYVIIVAIMIIPGSGVAAAQWSSSGSDIYNTNSGNVGIGTSSPAAKLTVHGSFRIESETSANETVLLGYNSSGDYSFVSSWDWGSSAPRDLILNGNGGNVGVGTLNPSHTLSVNGTIRAKEITVNTGWSDFVFEDDYRLMALEEVEQYIHKHGHLPGIPSASEVDNNGVSLGDISAKLLQKIEEMTLHIIQQEKELRRLNAALQEVQSEARY